MSEAPDGEGCEKPLTGPVAEVGDNDLQAQAKVAISVVGMTGRMPTPVLG